MRAALRDFVDQTDLIGEILQFAVIVGNADRTDVIPFRRKKRNDHSPVFVQFFVRCVNNHSFFHFCRAGGKEFGYSFDLHNA